MKIRIEIETDNDAFADDPDGEVARILTNVAASFETGGARPAVLRDMNGNACGQVEFIYDEASQDATGA